VKDVRKREVERAETDEFNEGEGIEQREVDQMGDNLPKQEQNE